MTAIGRLKERMRTFIPAIQARDAELAQYNEVVIHKLTVGELRGSLHGVPGAICNTSSVPNETGLLIRKVPISDLTEMSPEGIYWFLLTGEKPSTQVLSDIQEIGCQYKRLPAYETALIASGTRNGIDPMVLACNTISTMNRESQFAKLRDSGSISLEEGVDALLEDCLKLLSCLPLILGSIYQRRKGLEEIILPDSGLSWAQKEAEMLGCGESNTSLLASFMRVWKVLMADHEAGNASAFTARTVFLAGTGPFQSTGAGGLALNGVYHGRANLIATKSMLAMLEHFGGLPSEEELEAYTRELCSQGHKVFGYGHAVLRCVDPRFTELLRWADRNTPGEEMPKAIRLVQTVATRVLRDLGKAKNPNPNVDAASGPLLHSLGVTDHAMYPALFLGARAIGFCAQMMEMLILKLRIMRPDSATTSALLEQCRKGATMPKMPC